MPHLWQETPLIHSAHLSTRLGVPVYLKLENLHPSHSFKYRGISLFAQRAKERHGPSVHLIIASGGNAGLAAACAAHHLRLKCTVFLPEGAATSTLALLRQEKAEVVVSGKIYADALKVAQTAVETEPNAVMVPPYDDPIVWEGHSSMINEISDQLADKPAAIFCSVGGGGLLGGIITGCDKVGWQDVPIVALGTIGSDCFYHSVALNEGGWNQVAQVLPENVELVQDEEAGLNMAHFKQFSSKAAGSLGASLPSVRVLKMALTRVGGVVCASVPDELSMQANCQFSDDHKFLVELACSTTLTPAYKPELFKHLVPKGVGSGDKRAVVFIVCGGFKISLNDMDEYRRVIRRDMAEQGRAWNILGPDGKGIPVNK